jgi:hypothetical protein
MGGVSASGGGAGTHVQHAVNAKRMAAAHGAHAV